MKKAYLLIFFFASQFIALNSLAQTFHWARGAGTTNADMVMAVASDKVGNLYSLGYYTSGSITFGTGITLSNSGGKDLYLLKQSCSGAPIWAVRIGGTGNEGGGFNNGGLAYDSIFDIIYVAASFEGICTFGTTSGTNGSLTSQGNSDGFVARYTSSGVRQWVTQLGSNGWDEATDVMMESPTTLIVSGFFSGNCTFFSNGSGINGSATSVGNTDGFMVRYSISGQYLNNVRAGGNSQDGIFKITKDRNGNILAGIGTCCSGNIQIGSFTIPNTGNWGGVVAKLSSNFSTWQWAAYIGGNGADTYGHPIVDDSNNVYAMFSSASTGTSLSSTAGGTFSFTPDNMDMIWAKFSSSGVLQHAQLISAPGYNQSFFGGRRTDGKMFVTGWFEDSITISSGSSIKKIRSTGGRDAFLFYYHANGTLDTTLQGGGAGDDLFTTASANQTTVFAGGFYSGNATYGNQSLNNAGNYDAVTVKVITQLAQAIKDSISSSKIRLCNSDTARLQWINNGQTASYQWLRNNSVISGATQSFYVASTTGSYSVVLNRCDRIDTSNAIVIQADTVRADAGPDKFICLGDTAQIQGKVTGSGVSFSWSPGFRLVQPDSLNTQVFTDSSLAFVLTAIKSNCISRDTVRVNVEHCCLSCQSETSINQGLVACYPFNGNGVDESGNSINAVIGSNVNLVRLDTNRFNINSNGYKFNHGWTESMKLQVNPSMRAINGKFSISCWVNVQQWTLVPSRLIRIAPIMSMQNKLWLLHLRDNNTIEFETSPTFRYASKQIAFKLNEWVNIGITCDSSYLFFYYNGNLIDSTPYTHNPSLPFETAFSPIDTMLLVGTGRYLNFPVPADRYSINGKMDDIRIYNRTLSPAEVWQLYSGSGSKLAGKSDTVSGCGSDSVQLLARKSEFYQWSPAGKVSKSDIQNPKIKPDSSLTFYVNLRNNRCQTTDTLHIRITPSKLDSVSDTFICPGDSIQLTAKGGSSYQWQPAYGVSNPTISNPYLFPDSTTRYVIKITDGSCFRYDTAWVNVRTLPEVSIRSFYQNDTIHVGCWGSPFPQRAQTTGQIIGWWPSQFVNDTLADTVWVRLPQSGYLGVNVQDVYCKASDSVFVEIDTSAKGVGLGPDITLCRGDSVLLKPITNINLSHGRISPAYGLNFLPAQNDWAWASPDSSVKYILTGFTSILCGVKDTIQITVIEKPKITIAAGDTVLCAGDSTLVSATGAQSYTWIKGDNIFSPTDSVTGIRPLSSQYYTVRGIRNGCTITDSVWLRINQLPLVFAGSDTAMCYGDTLLLEATSPTATQFFWNNSNIPAAQLRVSPLSTSLYIVKASDSLCTSKEDSVRVTIHPNPSAAFALLPDRGEAPLPVRIIDQSTDVQFYQWHENDTVFSTLANPTKVFFKPGTYQIKLLVTSDKGCVDTLSKYLYVDTSSKPVFFIPNVITPDGDGMNDYFTIESSMPVQSSCVIRNRWGQVMYEKGMNFEPVNWNGRQNGMECPDGAYYFFINLYTDGIHAKEYTGILQLIR